MCHSILKDLPAPQPGKTGWPWTEEKSLLKDKIPDGSSWPKAGPMHLAAAVGTPVVEISCHPLHGSVVHHNSPKRFGPFGVPHIVLQPEKPLPPCSDGCTATQAHCILNVSVMHVRKAVEKFIKQRDFTFSSKGRCNE